MSGNWITPLSFIIGCCIGSFINVVSLRLPTQIDTSHSIGIPNWLLSRSHCLSCHQPIRAWHNIPLLSFIWLRGQCAYCQQYIKLRYPLIELTVGLLTAVTISQFTHSTESIYAALLTWFLICLTVIDWEHQLLPDVITLPLLWLGLMINLQHQFVPLPTAVIGAISGYLSLSSLSLLYYTITKRIGMGHGDFKLFAALGAWFGWPALPYLLLFATGLGCVINVTLMLIGKRTLHTPFAFGPYLACAAWCWLMWRHCIY